VTYRIPLQDWPDFDPAPNVPTLEEIQLAEELRHRLELRFLPGDNAHAGRIGAVRPG
jgi:hypothetical protein